VSEIGMSLRVGINTLLLFCGLSGVVMAEPRPYVVNVQVAPPSKGDYFIDLLSLMLNASKAPDEVIEFHFGDKQLSQARWVMAVSQDKGNNVLWVMTNKLREDNLRAIRAPLLKGLMGYRALVIRKDDEARFKNINTLQDLLDLKVGQGMHWPDTDILRANQFQTVEAMETKNLYKMLVAKRFDFFPRSITELYLEEDFIRDQNLMVEPRLLLHYPTGLYFFVNKKNTELAGRLDKGWEIIQKNGEFEKFFLAAKRVQLALDILKHDHTVIELQNPFLSPETIKLLARQEFRGVNSIMKNNADF
jgi:hypothetical protein